MAALKGAAHPNGLVFRLNAANFRRNWHETTGRLGLCEVGPPHTLRHSGASNDVAKKRRTLEEVRRRGRWSQPKSVQRYTKVHLLAQHLSRVPSCVTSSGSAFSQDPAKTILQTIPKHVLAKTVFADIETPLQHIRGRLESGQLRSQPRRPRARSRASGSSG